jgi:ATP-binding cassette subfamily B protein RaxB
VLLSNNTDLALVVTLSFVAVYIISAITQSLRGLLTIKIGAKLTYLLSAGLLRHTTNLPVQFFERRNIGDIVSRFSSMRPLQDFISESIVGICLDLLMVITTFLMISLYSLQAGLYVFSLCLFYLLVQYLLTLPYRAHLHEQLIAEAQVQSHFIETIQTIDSIKRFEGTARRRSAWLNHLVRSLNAHVRSRYWELAAKIASYLFLGMVLLGVVYISVEKIELGLLTIGMLYTLVTYSNHFTNALVSLTHEWQAYLMLSLHVGRVSDITDHHPDAREPLSLHEPVNRIQVKDLDFGHTGSELLINNLNLQVQGSQKVAIVGASGSGKSTLFSLLRGDVSAAKGQILINNRPLSSNLNPVALYASLQPNDVLLTGTVTDNIAFLDPTPDTNRILAAARAALVHDDILRLPMSYSEKLSEQGCLLSAGQRQRILIARTLYRRAEILLLDEATSHLDPASELEIMKNILSLPVPCFFITHRPDIAALADHIVELKPLEPAQDDLALAAR